MWSCDYVLATEISAEVAGKSRHMLFLFYLHLPAGWNADAMARAATLDLEMTLVTRVTVSEAIRWQAGFLTL